ncbi:7108_t:CDS:2 [Paraglomus brasilianum]|uniref:7108_t:CDS:1 n=1 Tax=Paraglomus brasilianum TaxID=144538 RepID=A0A9N9GAS9_9GLOM|nr:7108_t:CDS:2 [Paraglomus brasilianum]
MIDEYNIFSNPRSEIRTEQLANLKTVIQNKEISQKKELELQQQTETLQKAAEIEQKLKEAQDSLSGSSMTWEKIKTKYPEFASRSILLEELEKADKLLGKDKDSETTKPFAVRLSKIPLPNEAEQQLLAQLYLTPEQFIALSCQAQYLTEEEMEDITNNYPSLATSQKFQLLNSGLNNLGINNYSQKEKFVQLNHTLYHEKKNFGLTTSEKEGVLRLLVNTLNLSEAQRNSLENMGTKFLAGEQKSLLEKAKEQEKTLREEEVQEQKLSIIRSDEDLRKEFQSGTIKSTSSRYDDLLANLSQEEAERQRKKLERQAAQKKLEEAERKRREEKLAEKDQKLKENEERRAKERELAEQEEIKRREAEVARAESLQKEQEALFKKKQANIEEAKRRAEENLANQIKANELAEKKKRDEIEKMEKENQAEQKRLANQAQLIEEEKQKKLAQIALEDKEERQRIEKQANEEKARIQEEINRKKQENERELKKKENALLKEKQEKQLELEKLEKEVKLQETLGKELEEAGRRRELMLKGQKNKQQALRELREQMYQACLNFYLNSDEIQQGTRYQGSPVPRSGCHHLHELVRDFPNMTFNLHFGDIYGELAYFDDPLIGGKLENAQVVAELVEKVKRAERATKKEEALFNEISLERVADKTEAERSSRIKEIDKEITDKNVKKAANDKLIRGLKVSYGTAIEDEKRAEKIIAQRNNLQVTLTGSGRLISKDHPEGIELTSITDTYSVKDYGKGNNALVDDENTITDTITGTAGAGKATPQEILDHARSFLENIKSIVRSTVTSNFYKETALSLYNDRRYNTKNNITGSIKQFGFSYLVEAIVGKEMTSNEAYEYWFGSKVKEYAEAVFPLKTGTSAYELQNKPYLDNINDDDYLKPKDGKKGWEGLTLGGYSCNPKSSSVTDDQKAMIKKQQQNPKKIESDTDFKTLTKITMRELLLKLGISSDIGDYDDHLIKICQEALKGAYILPDRSKLVERMKRISGTDNPTDYASTKLVGASITELSVYKQRREDLGGKISSLELDSINYGLQVKDLEAEKKILQG